MFNGLRNIKTVSAIALNRLELYAKLLTVETRIETALLVRRLMWIAVGVVFALFALAMAHIAVIGYFLRSEQLPLVIGGMLLFDALIAGFALYKGSQSTKAEAFTVTKQQLAEDIKYIKDAT